MVSGHEASPGLGPWSKSEPIAGSVQSATCVLQCNVVRELKSTLATRAETPEARKETFELMRSAALADGLPASVPPEPELIDVALECGVTQLRPQPMSARAWLARLEPAGEFASPGEPEREGLIARSALFTRSWRLGTRARRCSTRRFNQRPRCSGSGGCVAGASRGARRGVGSAHAPRQNDRCEGRASFAAATEAGAELPRIPVKPCVSHPPAVGLSLDLFRCLFFHLFRPPRRSADFRERALRPAFSSGRSRPQMLPHNVDTDLVWRQRRGGRWPPVAVKLC